MNSSISLAKFFPSRKVAGNSVLADLLALWEDERGRERSTRMVEVKRKGGVESGSWAMRRKIRNIGSVIGPGGEVTAPREGGLLQVQRWRGAARGVLYIAPICPEERERENCPLLASEPPDQPPPLQEIRPQANVPLPESLQVTALICLLLLQWNSTFSTSYFPSRGKYIDNVETLDSAHLNRCLRSLVKKENIPSVSGESFCLWMREQQEISCFTSTSYTSWLPVLHWTASDVFLNRTCS